LIFYLLFDSFQITLSQICRSPLQNNFPFGPDISDELRRKFDQWWATQLTPQANPMAHKILPFVNPPTPEFDFPSVHSLNNVNREALLDSAHHANHHNMIVHPALQTVHSQYPNQKTRMRTSFDPEMELPKLQRWFHENPHPSRQQIQTYVVQLNSLESRRGRKPLDVNNVVYWFKNARAAQKRAEMRGQSLTNGYAGPGIMMPHAEYMKSSPSAPSDDIDNISQHSDDMDDDMDRPSSPLQVPLSLTMHERNRSPVNDDAPTKSDQGFKLEDTDGRASKSPVLEKSDNIINNNDGTAENHNSDDHNDDGDQSSKNHCDDVSKSNFSCERASTPQQLSPKSEDLDVDEPDDSNLEDYRSPSPDSRRLSFPMSNSISNSMFSHSIMYMSHYIPTMANQQQQQQQQQQQPGQLGNSHHGLMSPSASGLNLSSFSNDERRKRNRTFIDPVTEVPKLEQWFSMNTHPSHNMILKYTEDLNRMPYR
jgi:homeobox domain-containing protein